MSHTLAMPATMAASAEAKPAWRIPRRPLKMAAAGTLLMAGAYGAFSEQIFISSSDAVVSAYVLDVRAPIEGTVTGLPRGNSSAIAQGDVLAAMRNALVDHQHLDNLRTVEETADSNASADGVEVAALAQQQAALLQRASAHATAVSDRLTHAVDEAKSTLAGREQALALARRDLQRGTALHDAGIIPHAEYDRLVTTEAIAQRGVEAQREAVISLQSQQAAAVKGLLSEPGTNNDVAYSHQRADEIATRMAEVQRSLAASRAQATQAHTAVAAERERSNQLHGLDVRSPISGQLWQVTAMDGERLAAGDPLLSMVDCSRQFLLVEVPQDRLPQLAIGGEARFRLAGETVERTGTVLSASGDPQKEVNHKFAAFPLQDTTKELATVRVSMAPLAAGNTACAVGRTAHVMLPTLPSSLASRTTRRWF